VTCSQDSLIRERFLAKRRLVHARRGDNAKQDNGSFNDDQPKSAYYESAYYEHSGVPRSVDLFEVLLDDRLVMVRATPTDFADAYSGNATSGGGEMVIDIAKSVASRFCRENQLMSDAGGADCTANLKARIRACGKLREYGEQI
jgi:hypothetical protein